MLSRWTWTILAKWNIRPRSMAIPGVANVAIWASAILVPGSAPSAPSHNGDDCSMRRSSRVTDTAAVAGGGFIDMLNRRIAVRHLAAMAVVILGGLVTSTLLNLGLMPALYLAFGRTGTRPEDEEAEEISSSKTIGVNGPSQTARPALAAVSVPAGSGD